jgi:hypothetical protein
VRRETDSALGDARRAFQAGQVVRSLRSCDRIARLLEHLGPESQQAIRRQTEELVIQLLSTHGVVIEPPHGEFVFGSQSSYVSTLVPVLIKALESKGYLPYRESSPWRALWSHAHYHLRLDVSEYL